MQWCFGPFRLDLEQVCLWHGVQRVPLRPKTFDLLVYLVRHAGELVSKEALLEAVWPDTSVAEGVLTTSIGELRKVLRETARHPRFIATVHRRGYRFLAPVAAVDDHDTAASSPAHTPRRVVPQFVHLHPEERVGLEAASVAAKTLLYGFGDFAFDADRRELRQAGHVVAIEPKVFQVLRYFLEHHDRVVTKDEFLEQCWPDTCVSEAALSQRLTKLRKIVHSDSTSIHDDPEKDIGEIWRDMTTLFITLYRGRMAAGAAIGQGIMRVHLHDFLKQLTTFRVRHAPQAQAAARAYGQFMSFFFGMLWETYVKPLTSDNLAVR